MIRTPVLHRSRRSRTAVFVALVSLLMLALPAPVAQAEPHWCGSGCNGKDPRAVVILLDGSQVRCSDSARHVGGPYNPVALGGEGQPPIVDTKMQVWHTYSGECQTTWVTARNLQGVGRSSCSMYELRTVAPRYRANGACPAAGKTTTTPMVDDHDAQYRAINFGHFEETIPYSQGNPFFVDTNYY